MTKRILMPVDRFPRADAVAAIVAEIARGSHAVVRLLHVAPQPSAIQDAKGRVVAFVDQEMESLKCEGLDALRPLEVYFSGLPVESVVRFGDPAAQIAARFPVIAQRRRIRHFLRAQPVVEVGALQPRPLSGGGVCSVKVVRS